MLHPKKVGDLPQKGSEELKRTNEIKIAVPTLDALDIQGKDITADALLTQREFARYLVEQRNAHYHFTVKGNQPILLKDLKRSFRDRQQPDFEKTNCGHGRIETRKIWTTTELNTYLDFPHVQQTYAVEHKFIEKKTEKQSSKIAYCITCRPPEEADAHRLLTVKRGHWSVERVHYLIDWNYNEDRSCIRKGHGLENMTRLRRLAISLIKSKKAKCFAHGSKNASTQLQYTYGL